MLTNFVERLWFTIELLGARGKKWPESQTEIDRERLSLECLPCGRSGGEGYIIKFESIAIAEYSAIHERMREHVRREHPETIPTCKKCGYTDKCIKTIKSHETACRNRLPSRHNRAVETPKTDGGDGTKKKTLQLAYKVYRLQRHRLRSQGDIPNAKAVLSNWDCLV